MLLASFTTAFSFFALSTFSHPTSINDTNIDQLPLYSTALRPGPDFFDLRLRYALSVLESNKYNLSSLTLRYATLYSTLSSHVSFTDPESFPFFDLQVVDTAHTQFTTVTLLKPIQDDEPPTWDLLVIPARVPDLLLKWETSMLKFSLSDAIKLLARRAEDGPWTTIVLDRSVISPWTAGFSENAEPIYTFYTEKFRGMKWQVGATSGMVKASPVLGSEEEAARRPNANITETT